MRVASGLLPIAFGTAAISLALFLGACGGGAQVSGEIPFDQEAWHNWSCCEDLTRYRMHNSLERRLPGASRADVIALLGPSEDDEVREWGCLEGDCLVYALGLEPGIIRIDPNHLVVRLRDGVVTVVEVI